MGEGDSGPEDNSCFTAVVETEDPAEAALLLRYWRSQIGPTGQPEFLENVGAIAEDLDVQSAEVSQRARAAGYATREGVVCPACEQVWPWRTRSDRPGQWSRCPECKIEQAKVEADRREATKAEQAERQQLLDRHLSRGDLDGEGVSGLGDFDGWAFTDVIDLLTWLYAVGPDGVLVPAHLHDAALFATGRVESRLWRLGVLGIDPTTDIDAFVWDGPPREELPTFYAVKARFYVQGLGPLRERVDDAIQELEAVLAGSWPQPWVEEATELAVSVLAGEAMRYLNHVVQRHRLPEANRDQSARFEVAARVALASYSLGQCYFLLWRAAKDGAAATKRNPMSLADGTGHAVNQFQRNVKWSGERGWEVKEYGAVRELPFTWQAQVLFERTLKVEVLAVHAREVKALAADRLDDDETVARLLAEGIPGDRAGDALERFRTSPSYGDSVDRLVEALRAVADSVQSAGGSASDALRAAYFSLEGLSVLGSSSDYELEEARLAIIEAVRG